MENQSIKQIVVILILSLLVLFSCQGNSTEPSSNENNIDELTHSFKNNDFANLKTKALHIVSAKCNSVSDRTSYWTVRIRYNDSTHQHGTTYIKATIADPFYQTTVTHRMGRSIEYYGPYGGVEVDYSVTFFLPCYFEQAGSYHFKIYYYEDDGVTRIDNYPSSNYIDVYHSPSLCK